jgi:tripartite-type tricarboxylate transporter receptor subunit TctC
VGELVALARAKPGVMNYASGGTGSTSHFAVAMFVAMAGISDLTVHVPYKGGGPAMNAMLAGETQFYFGPIAGMAPFIESGAVRPLAISGDRRSPSLPDVPTMAEAGLPQYKAVGWFGLFAPAGTNGAIVQRLSEAVAESLKDPQVVRALETQGIDGKASSPAEFARFVDEQLALHRRLVSEMRLDLGQ